MNRKVLIIFLLFFAAIIVIGCSYVYLFLNTIIDSDHIIYIKKGYTVKNVVKNLEEDGLIDNKFLAELTIRFKTKNKPNIRYGEYFFKKNSTINDVLNKIINNDVYYRSITFAEGLSTNSILKMIEKNEYLTGDIPEKIPEGSLLPQTYNFLKGDTRESLIRRMQKDMFNTINKYWDGRAKDLPIKTKEEAIILASIVEKETGIAEERPLVASVFVNRLKINMPLQSDPTSIYGYAFGDVEKEDDVKVYKLIRENSPYNTYKIKRLPPTPICNPGEESIKAVLNPADTKYLFFFATGDGGHSFSEKYIEHVRKINDYKRNRK